MNRAAAALGLADTSYTNPIGLDAPGNYSSARDLAALADRLLRTRPSRRVADSPTALLRQPAAAAARSTAATRCCCERHG